MITYSTAPQKQNQNFVKGHNMASLRTLSKSEISNRCILSRQNPWVLTQVQMKERVGVVITGAQGLRKRSDTWGGGNTRKG